MKILCISDHIDPVVYSNRILKRFNDVNFIISCGDLRLNYYDFIITNLNKRLFFVFGNHHLEDYNIYKEKLFRNLHYFGEKENTGENKNLHFQSVGATYIDEKCIRYEDMLIMGLNGSMWYNGGDNQFTELSMFFKILRMVPRLLWNKIFYKRYLDILITHAPPFEIHDQKDPCHRGFKVFLWFMRIFKPRYLIHGHIHLYAKNSNRIDMYHETVVINAYDHFVLEVNNK